MNIHEYGNRNGKTIVLIHPSLVRWDYFEYVIPFLENDFHLLIPALPGYDAETAEDFSSVEETASRLAGRLKENGRDDIHAVYGCSMGGSIALRMTADAEVKIRHCIMDGGITPYQLPRLLTRPIALRDYCLVMAGRAGGIRLLEKAFAADKYSPEDLRYVSDILKSCSRRTIWNTFDSCNNYRMPDLLVKDTAVHYWYAENEEKERAWDIRYMREHVPHTDFRKIPSLGHAGLAVRHPDLLAEMIYELK